MATDVSICNLALSHIGDSATVSSIDPPEGSAQASRCAQFYPMVRGNILEMHAWSFATRFVVGALLTSDDANWLYAYQVPSDSIKVWRVVCPSDREVGVDFDTGILSDGTKVVYTDQEDAQIQYTREITDTAKFSPLFSTAFSWHLASFLAGPVVGGESGRRESIKCQEIFTGWLSRAIDSDSNQKKTDFFDRDSQGIAAR